MNVPERKIIEISSIEKKKHLYEVKASPFVFLLDEGAFTDFYLYPEKKLSEEEVRRLKEASETSSLNSYAISLLNRKRYSKSEMKDKLFSKSTSEDAVSKVLDNLLSYGLLDDEAYAKDYKEEKENALFGRRRIKEELRFKRRISPQIVNALLFSNEKEHAQQYLLSISKSLSSYPYGAKKKKAHDILLRRGYEEEDITYALRSLKEEDKDKVVQRMEMEASRAYNRYKRKYEGKELKSHVYSFLYRKGYGGEDIASCLERIINEH